MKYKTRCTRCGLVYVADSSNIQTSCPHCTKKWAQIEHRLDRLSDADASRLVHNTFPEGVKR